ncbi:MAG: site-2 protease family protein [Anaerolineales bacterium]|nr:site-2 protease family protein [Anaerolineales bacterium]
MGQSIKLFSVRGIAVRMHLTFPLILAWAALQFGVLARGGWTGAIFGVIATSLLFIVVILHELGHSFTAQRFGVEVKQIVLLPIGGVAQLAHIPEKPTQEFLIAIAGPAVNFGLAIFLGVVAWIAQFNVSLEQLPGLLLNLDSMSLAALFTYTFASNLLLGVFNLIPAFPMDGGRILRALLAMRMSYPRATVIAVGIGQLLAILMGAVGFLQGNFFWVLIAIFIFTGAGQERQLVLARSVLGDLTVEQAYSRGARSLAPGATLRDAVELTLNSFQADFPVCDGAQLVGILTHARLVEALNQHGPDKVVSEVMLSDIAPAAPGDNLLEVQQRLAELNVDALPVSQGGAFLGLITNRDINEIYRLASIRAGSQEAGDPYAPADVLP